MSPQKEFMSLLQKFDELTNGEILPVALTMINNKQNTYRVGNVRAEYILNKLSPRTDEAESLLKEINSFNTKYSKTPNLEPFESQFRSNRFETHQDALLGCRLINKKPILISGMRANKVTHTSKPIGSFATGKERAIIKGPYFLFMPGSSSESLGNNTYKYHSTMRVLKPTNESESIVVVSDQDALAIQMKKMAITASQKYGTGTDGLVFSLLRRNQSGTLNGVTQIYSSSAKPYVNLKEVDLHNVEIIATPVRDIAFINKHTSSRDRHGNKDQIFRNVRLQTLPGISHGIHNICVLKESPLEVTYDHNEDQYQWMATSAYKVTNNEVAYNQTELLKIYQNTLKIEAANDLNFIKEALDENMQVRPERKKQVEQADEFDNAVNAGFNEIPIPHAPTRNIDNLTDSFLETKNYVEQEILASPSFDQKPSIPADSMDLLSKAANIFQSLEYSSLLEPKQDKKPAVEPSSPANKSTTAATVRN